ncbi:MAG: mechanosensitive ion channel family protein, partial [Cyclobacteriaceae bacterium]
MDGLLSYEFKIGLDYGADYQKAMDLIKSTLTTIPGFLTEDNSPTVFIEDMAPSSLTVKVTYWVDTYDPLQPDLK